MAIVLGEAVLSGSPSVTAAASASLVGAASLVGGASVSADGIATATYTAPAPTGGIVLGGGAVYSRNADITILQDFTWNLRGSLTVFKKFTWQTGTPPLYWYRVVGKCITPSCENGNTSPPAACDGIPQAFMTMVLARTVSDVCDQLRKKGQIWPIATIHKHSKPAEQAQIIKDEAAGISHNCDRLIEVPFCEYPPCLDFCIDAKVAVTGGLSMTGGIVKSFRYVGSGSVRIGGSGTGAILPKRYVGTGGITLGGTAGVRSSMWGGTGSGGITLGGTAAVKSSNWRYVGSGGITLGGEAAAVSPFYRVEGSGGVTLGGSATASVGYSYTPTGGVVLNGIAPSRVGYASFIADQPTGGVTLGGAAVGKCSHFEYTPTGGVTVGGSAVVKSTHWRYTPTGGITLGGGAAVRWPEVAVGSGGVTLGGTAGLRVVYRYEATGGITLGGTVSTVSPFYSYVPTGGIVLGGSAEADSNFLGTFVAYGGLTPLVAALSADFGGEAPAPVLEGADGLVGVGCGCPFLPSSMQLFHNLPDIGGLSDFLTQNGLTLADELTIFYSRLTNSWRTNVHLAGVGSNGSDETWTILMEWQCTSNIGSFELGSNVWKFSLLLTRKNDGFQKDYDTRVLVAFSQDGVCGQRPFEFGFALNTSKELVSVDEGDAIVNTEILYDETGVFRSTLWLKDPVLRIRIAEAGTVPANNRIDLTYTTPVAAAIG